MRIPKDTWEKYIAYLHKMSDEAATKMAAFLETVDINTKEGLRAVLNYGFQLSNVYGAGASEMACQMYERVAEASGKNLPPAEPAELPTYKDVAKTVQGKMRDSKEPKAIGSSIGRLVKRTGVDTTMKNAIRDGAEWAWVPHGDSCAFCLALGANGWQKASKKALKDGHARHIHDNCDCTYAIRFDKKSYVEGYAPDRLKAILDAAEGDTWEEKIKNTSKTRKNKEKVSNEKDVIFTTKQGNDIIIPSKQFGKKAGKHAHEFGLDVSSEDGRKRYMSIVQDIIQNCTEVRYGEWRAQPGECEFYIKGEDVVIVNNGRYITTLKGGVNNERIANARKHSV